MHKAANPMLGENMRRSLIRLAVAAAVLAILFLIAGAYLEPGLRKAIVYSGFGMC